MSDIVIRVENLGKKYVIGHQQQEKYTALRDVLANKAKELTQFFNLKSKVQNPKYEDFWALEDVSFEVKRGDRIGIIGRNGAGKSTLLKILSRITEPTTGRISIKGRVASLLEVGTGFHPELTGRENIFLNGAILGMSKQEIRRNFDEIVAFAEVERFLDTPVKRYSSGMYVRLAFSVAAHLESEILVVDEVLAVGDTKFQNKCLGKMSEITNQDRTVLFVSHHMPSIRNLCNSGVLLSKGRGKYFESVDTAINVYLNSNEDKEQLGRMTCQDSRLPSSDGISLVEVFIKGSHSAEYGIVTVDEPVDIGIVYNQEYKTEDYRFIIQVLNTSGETIFASTDHQARQQYFNSYSEPGTFKLSCQIPPNLMNIGSYTLRVRVGSPGSSLIIPNTDLCSFKIIGQTPHGSSYDESWPGMVCPKLSWNIEALKK